MVNPISFNILCEKGRAYATHLAQHSEHVMMLEQQAKAARKKFSFGQPQKAEAIKEHDFSFGVKDRSKAKAGLKWQNSFLSTKRFDSPPESAQNIQKICEDFYAETGIHLHCPTNWDLSAFNDSLVTIATLKANGLMPKGIKHLLIGHGTGLSLNNSWSFCGGENIFQYINRTIPPGEKVLVACCEVTKDNLIHLIPKNRPEIGYPVATPFSDAKLPGKIVQSGKNEIIDYFYYNIDSTVVHTRLNHNGLNFFG